MKRHTSAFTLVEALVASAILMIAVSAAAVLALATLTQEETNARVARCTNLHEQAMRLFQIGLAPSTINAVLPADPAVTDMPVFSVQTVTIANLGTVERADSTITFATTPLSDDWQAGTWSSGESSGTARRSQTLTAIRPALR
ncbi:MAG: prepilin-type N-terminal cleavage/methylation domain-containing protein [Chthoniobacterales bacterium]